jgi:hypothetical protein
VSCVVLAMDWRSAVVVVAKNWHRHRRAWLGRGARSRRRGRGTGAPAGNLLLLAGCSMGPELLAVGEWWTVAIAGSSGPS